MNAPCYNCQERVAGCHATCKKYEKYTVENKARNARMKESRLIGQQRRGVQAK